MKLKSWHVKRIDDLLNSKSNAGFRISPSSPHKKGKLKCYGLLLAFFITFGLSLSVFSNVSATTYSLDGFLAYPFRFPVSSESSSSGSGIIYSLTSADSVPSKIRTGSYLTARFDSSTNKCVYQSVTQPGYFVSGDTISWSGSFIPPFVSSSLSSNQLCQTMLAFGSNSIPEFDSSTVPLDKKITVSSFLPYSYMYNTLSLSNVRTVDGVQYTSDFDVSELLNNPADPGDEDFVYYTDVLRSIHFPLNFYTSEVLNSSTSLQFSGTLVFGSGLTDSEVSNLVGTFSLSKFYSGGSESGFSSSSCTFSSQNSSNTHIDFLCSGLVNSVSYNNFSLSFGLYTSDSSAFSSSKQSFTFSSFYVVTNDTPTSEVVSGSIFGNGSYPNVAPGVPQVNPDNADWFSSLTNLFTFGFLNPFAPIFQLFSDNNSCASIPIIAGMIHSEETQVCPWFDSTTRNIVTPVLGLFSMMLVFGFAVHWLGARSGNLFEDSVSTDNYSFRSRVGGRKK